MKISELERIWAIDAPGILRDEVVLGKTEHEVIANEIDPMSKIRIGEREIELSGITKWKPLILKVVADFKEKKRARVMPRHLAASDQITVEPLRPEVFGEDNYQQASLEVGAFDIIPKGASGVYDVKDDEVIIITDAIEFNPAANTTAIKGVDIDGEDYTPLDHRISTRGTDLQLVDLIYPFVSDRTLDLDGKMEFAGDTELTPIGVHICLGALLPDLT